jgi:Domain of unknown function (DUF4406)
MQRLKVKWIKITWATVRRKNMTDYAPGDPVGSSPEDVVLSLVHSCGIVGPDAYIIQHEFAGQFDRTHNKQESIRILLSVVGRCADARHPFAYLSVPLTTGRSYIQMRAQHVGEEDNNPAELRAERDRTIADNRARAYEAARRLRSAIAGMVLDPSRLIDVPGWEQQDYHAFWAMVINQYAEEVFFLDGWQYSVGCTIEFSEAVKIGLPTLTANLASLNPSAGWRLVHDALEEYTEVGLDPQPLRDALSITEDDLSRPQSHLRR